MKHHTEIITLLENNLECTIAEQCSYYNVPFMKGLD